MVDDQDPKLPLSDQRKFQASDIKVKADLGKLPEVIRASEALANYNRNAELALGSAFKDIQANADRYRALLEPSPAVKAALVAITAEQDLLKHARLAAAGNLAGMVKTSLATQHLAEEQRRLSASLRMNSESFKYIQDQISAGRTAQLAVNVEQIAALRAADIKRFELPATTILASQFQALEHDRLYATSKLLQIDPKRIAEAAAGLRTPWIEASNNAASLTRFSGLHSLGTAIRLESAYSDEVAGAIRASLGDWRERISRDFDTLSNLSVRTGFYVEHGLDRTLTDWPDDAFEQSLDVTEIRGAPPTLVDLYGSPVLGESDPDNEAGFIRNNVAHDWLQRFETQIRQFIDAQMSRVFGEGWPERQLPNHMLDKWRDKQKRDPYRDRHSRIIIYADFTDYEQIICKRDNFKEVFALFFSREEHFRESMQRLAVPRIQVMHARLLTQDDELLLFAELRRLTSQFGRIH